MLTDQERHELGRMTNRDAIKDWLLATGFSYAAEGCFGQVYVREADQTAVKVTLPTRDSDNGFDGAYAYAKWVHDTKPDNPAFPKIASVMAAHRLNGEPHYYVVEMEALHQYPQGKAHSYNDGLTDLDAIRAGMGLAWSRYDATSTTAERDNAHRAGQAIKAALCNEYSTDMSRSNFMYRGTQPVITDPISFKQ